jgi:hypothetical protein
VENIWPLPASQTVGIVALGAIHAGVKSFFTIPVRALFTINVIGF